MEKYSPIILEKSALRRGHAHQRGFSLVEVVIAIGIVAFGIMAVFGLLPAGLDIFRQSMDSTVSSQILQRIINEVQETDFDQLIKDQAGGTISTSGTGVKAIRYFDAQGNELTEATAAIYHVNTRIQAATQSPGNSSLPNSYLATVTVQVAKNPGGLPLANETDSAMSNLWSGAYEGATVRVVPIYMASTMVSR